MSMISWVENMPSSTSRVGDFPAFARSTWTAITTGLATSLYWDASGGASEASAGGLKPGGSRAFFDVASRSSAPNSHMTGRAFLASDTSRLFVYDSGATYLGGTPFYVEYQSNPPAGQVVLMQSGSTMSTWAGFDIAITFPLPFATPPSVHVSVQSTSVLANKIYAYLTLPPTTTGFTSVITALAGFKTNYVLYWTAIGSSASYL